MSKRSVIVRHTQFGHVEWQMNGGSTLKLMARCARKHKYLSNLRSSYLIYVGYVGSDWMTGEQAKS
jgi:hypothetical protein